MSSSFRDLGVPKKLNDALHSAGLTTPFPIQTQTIPHSLEGRDLCGRAPTGSGKTLAFAIPVVEQCGEGRPHHPTALILTPTRELANQVKDTIFPLAKARRRWVQSFYGGTNIKRDIAALRKGVDIAVATPGRLADLVQRGEMHLDEIRIVVLDEADRMADMGFLPEVKRLLDRTPSDRQTLLFSATLDGDVDVLVTRYQRDPVRVEVDAPEEEQGQVNHLFWPIDRSDRRAMTAQVLKRTAPAIVFTRTKHGADRLAKQLRKDGVETAAIHGNRSQNQRERALERLASGEVSALIATDVAARGIHIDDVAVVLHYDLPATEKDYVHRSGRTGRAGATGVVVSLVCEDQHGELRAMQRKLEMPEGLHEVELAHLDADVVPAPAAGASGVRPSGDRPRSKPRSRSGQGAGQGQRAAGGNGGRQPKGGARDPRNRAKGRRR